MKITQDILLPLINWPFVIICLTVGFFFRLNLGWLDTSIMIPVVLLFEFIRIKKITANLNERVDAEVIRKYYKADSANKWIPWRDQTSGLNRLLEQENIQ